MRSKALLGYVQRGKESQLIELEQTLKQDDEEKLRQTASQPEQEAVGG